LGLENKEHKTSLPNISTKHSAKATPQVVLQENKARQEHPLLHGAANFTLQSIKETTKQGNEPIHGANRGCGAASQQQTERTHPSLNLAV